MIYYCGGSFLARPTSEAGKSTHNAHLTFHRLFTMKKDSLLTSPKRGYMLSVQLHRHTFFEKKKEEKPTYFSLKKTILLIQVHFTLYFSPCCAAPVLTSSVLL